jgi:hypothetical protein
MGAPITEQASSDATPLISTAGRSFQVAPASVHSQPKPLGPPALPAHASSRTTGLVPSTHVCGTENESHVRHAACSRRRLNHHDGRNASKFSRRAVARAVKLPLRYQYLLGPVWEEGVKGRGGRDAAVDAAARAAVVCALVTCGGCVLHVARRGLTRVAGKPAGFRLVQTRRKQRRPAFGWRWMEAT